MSKVVTNSILAIIVATVSFYMLGYFWYGFLFSESWMQLTGITEVDAKAMQEKLGAMMFVWGLLITLVQVIGVWVVIHWSATAKLLTCVKIASLLAILIALPVLSYGALYQDTSIHLIGMDFLHLFLGYNLAAIVIFAFKSKQTN